VLILDSRKQEADHSMWHVWRRRNTFIQSTALDLAMATTRDLERKVREAELRYAGVLLGLF
jgi:hypothetical protein